MCKTIYLDHWETIPEAAATICGHDTPKLWALLQSRLDLNSPTESSKYIILLPLEIAVFQKEYHTRRWDKEDGDMTFKEFYERSLPGGSV